MARGIAAPADSKGQTPMKKLISIALVPLALACGAAQEAQQAADAAQAPKTEVAAKEPGTQATSANIPVAVIKPAAEAPRPEEEAASLTVINRYSMPACTEGREGQLAYVRDEKRFMVCEATAWIDAEVQTKGDTGAAGTDAVAQGVDIALEPAGLNCANGGQRIQPFLDANGNGELDTPERLVGTPKYACDGLAGANGTNGADGTNGTNGVDGATGATGTAGVAGTNGTNGAAGANGNDNHIVETYSCLGAAYDAAYASEIFELNAHYTVWITAFGDATVRARTWYGDNGPGQAGTDRAGSSTPWALDIHAKSQAEAYNYPVTQHLDLVSGVHYGKMEWSLNRGTLTATATYTDADLPTTPTRSWQISCLKSTY